MLTQSTTAAFRAFLREPFDLALGQPHQLLISSASVAIVAAEAAKLVPYPANILLAIGAEWAYLRGLISGAGVKTPWGAALNWAAGVLVFGYAALWGLRGFHLHPRCARCVACRAAHDRACRRNRRGHDLLCDAASGGGTCADCGAKGHPKSRGRTGDRRTGLSRGVAAARRMRSSWRSRASGGARRFRSRRRSSRPRSSWSAIGSGRSCDGRLLRLRCNDAQPGVARATARPPIIYARRRVSDRQGCGRRARHQPTGHG